MEYISWHYVLKANDHHVLVWLDALIEHHTNHPIGVMFLVICYKQKKQLVRIYMNSIIVLLFKINIKINLLIAIIGNWKALNHTK